MTVSIHSLVELTTSRTLSPSTMGAQLAVIQDGITTPTATSSDSVGAITRTLDTASILACMDGLIARGPPTNGKWGKVYPALAKLRSVSSLDGTYMPMGYLTVKVLRAYQEFGVRNPTRGLVRVYRWMSAVAPKQYVAIDGSEDEQIASFMALATKDVKAAKSVAADVYADAYLAAETFVAHWNSQGAQDVRKAS